MRCAALTILRAFCEGSAEIPFGCLSDRALGKVAVESERLSAAGSMSGMALLLFSQQGHLPGYSMGAGAPSRHKSGYQDRQSVKEMGLIKYCTVSDGLQVLWIFR